MSFQRTRMSADRTLMSVIRTSLSLISFGFTIFQVFEKLQGSERDHARRARRAISASTLVALGILMLVGGIGYHAAIHVRAARTSDKAMTADGLIHGESRFPAIAHADHRRDPAADRHRRDREHGLPGSDRSGEADVAKRMAAKTQKGQSSAWPRHTQVDTQVDTQDRQAQHPRHLGRRYRHLEPELLFARPDGLSHAQHRPAREGRHDVHRFLR